jgi:hypothetical protein
MIRGGADNSGIMQFFTANAGTIAERMRIDASGNVGIGSNSPATFGKFAVQDSGSGNGTISVLSSAASNIIYIKNTGTEARFMYNDVYPMTFGTNNAERMRITSAGNVGIGITSPSELLTVAGNILVNAGGNGYLQVNRSSGNPSFNTKLGWSGVNAYLTADSCGVFSLNIDPTNVAAGSTFSLGIDGTTRMVVDSSGNLGLGVTPSAWGSNWRALQSLSGGSVSFDAFATSYLSSNANHDGTSWKYVATRSAGQYRIDNNSHQWFNAPSGTAGNAITFTQAMTLDASGNLGVGTTSPLQRLDVASSATGVFQTIRSTSSGATNVALRIQDGTTGTTNTDGIYLGRTGAENFLWTYENEPWVFATNNTERMRIDSTGNALIGTTTNTNSSRLVVNGTISETVSSVQYLVASQFDVGTAPNQIPLNQYLGSLAFEDAGNAIVGNINATGVATFSAGTAAAPAITTTGDTNTGIFFPAADTIAFSEGGVESMRIDSSGNVGIGTSSPTVRLELSQSATTYTQLRLTNSASGNNGGQITFAGAVGTDIGWIRSNFPGEMLFGAYNGSSVTERMRITSGGNLLVGKTADNATTVGVQVTTAGIVNSASAASDYWNAYNTTASVYRFYVTSAGTVTATNTTISAISDQRLKENIVDLDDGLNSVMALKPRKFDWKAGKGKDIKGDRGFIAQEFETVFPDMIDEWKDPAPEGEEPYKAVNANLIPTLVKAIQEQQILINNLTTRLNALEGK